MIFSWEAQGCGPLGGCFIQVHEAHILGAFDE
jgi:hypothetical protein